MLEQIAQHCAALEECYELMLGYAGQGVEGEEGSTQIRYALERAASALRGLAALPPASERSFLDVLVRDSQDSLAAVELVLAQPRISSQLIDNLNASIHLRAVLTDLFLFDEILKMRSAEKPAGAL